MKLRRLQNVRMEDEKNDSQTILLDEIRYVEDERKWV